MRLIPAPGFDIMELVAAMDPSDEVSALREIEPHLRAIEQDYLAAGSNSTYYLLSKDPAGVGVEYQKRAKWAYKNRLVPQRGNARQFYEALREISGEFDCPTCLRREIEEVDHYLPKSKYGHFSILPLNLVPICSKCNRIKRSFHPTGPEDQLLHPYFDDLGDGPWLEAELVQVVGAPIKFKIRPLATWSGVLSARVVAHFEKFKLSDLYARQANGLLSNIRLTLSGRLLSAGPDAVRATLREYESSWHASRSEPWNVAALNKWAASDWFCAGGFGVLDLDPDDLAGSIEAVVSL
jgi:hypothetical protein